MTTSKKLKNLAISLAVLGAATAPAAFATTTDEVRVEIETRYLLTDWGVEKVYENLTNKAEKICDTGSADNISNRKYERDCMADLLNDFIKNANHEKLTLYHLSAAK